ncbi:MAG: hypothetical protein HFJ33_03320 [Clostridia bacterium]|nr:hypothetical protein [Clostridia bacterium]
MIDFHAHILPNIDDGARDIDETIYLVEEARKVGFEAIISTSHYMEGYYETNTPEREMWIHVIYQKLQEENAKMKLYLGNEIYLSENIMQLLEEQKASTINDTSYVLFEMPLNIEPMNLYNVVYEMMQNKLVPILAHPERYSFIQEEPEIVNELIEKGVLMQSNYASIIGYYGKGAQIIVKKLLRNNMVHFLGSDVHRANTIYPRIPQILEKIKEIVGKQKLEELTTTNPKLALKNQRIEIEEVNKIELTLKEKIMMKMSRGN